VAARRLAVDARRFAVDARRFPVGRVDPDRAMARVYGLN
jgi:hypothetical protein